MKTRRVFSTLVTPVLALLLIVGLAGVGQHLSMTPGDHLQSWQSALSTMRPYLLVWRMVLYAGLFVLWWDLHQRYQDRPIDQRRIHRLGLLGLGLSVVFEATRW